MPIRLSTGSITRITSIPRESALPHTGGVQNPRQRLSAASHLHQALHPIPRITSSTRWSPSNHLLVALPLVRPRPRPLIMAGRHPTSSCHHRFRFRSSITVTLFRPPFSQILGRTHSLFHKTTRIREGWILSTGDEAARTISGFLMVNKGDIHKTRTTRCLRSPAALAKTTLSSIITRMNRPPSTISPPCLHYPPRQFRISGHSASHRILAGTGRGRWMILICT